MPRAFVPNPRFERDMAASPEAREGERAIAEEIREQAEIIGRSIGAPWMPRDGHTTFEVFEDDAGVGVVNTDYGGHLMEWGSKNNQPHAPLRLGARAAGAEVDESD